mgnify:CR=1 FL=1
MFPFAIGALAFSLIGLISLFSIKHIELRRGTTFAPALRAKADMFARIVKAIMRFALARAEQLPNDGLVIARALVRIGAVFFARGARAAELAAHTLADRVSHKHHFERGETKSTFLRSVSEHKSNLSFPPDSLK